MTPSQRGAGGKACAALECGWSEDSGSHGVGVALGSASVACKHSARPAASKMKGISPPSCTKRALSATSDTDVSSALDSDDSEAASFARESWLRRSCFAATLSPLGRRLGQSLCQWGPLHHLQGAHFSLHFSFASGRGRLGSA
eukprot:42683-Pleurochrysis_carterae.AAC.1